MPTQLQWNPPLIARFWEGLAQSGIQDKLGFGKLAGPVLTEFVLPWIGRHGRCLDFGSGSGELVRFLLEAGLQVAAYEPNVVQAQAINQRLEKFPKFLGTVGDSDHAIFDFVICTEVIEHILKDRVGGFLWSLAGRVAPGGRVFLSTPNAEDLIENLAYCPVCDHTYHRWQHQRSWRPDEIVAVMEQVGFTTEWVGLVGFDDPNPVRDFNLRRRLGEAWPWMAEPDGERQIPLIGRSDHIIYIGAAPRDAVSPVREPDVAARADAIGEGVYISTGPSQQTHAEPPLRRGALGVMFDGVAALSGGLAEAKALGLDPVAVVPARVKGEVDARMLIHAGDLFRPREVGAVDAAGPAAVVFPGSNDRLERAIAERRVPDTSLALVFEDGQWRRARPARVRSVETGPHQHGPQGLRKLVAHCRAAMLSRLRTRLALRRLQPSLDRREADVLPTLLEPGDYPYRLKRVIEGRVLLATSSLGGGGAERQIVNTAEGLRARRVADVHILAEYLDSASGQDFYLKKAKAVAASVAGSPNHYYPAHPWALRHPRFRDVLSDPLISRILNVGTVIKQLAPEVVQISLDWSNITVGIAAVLAGVPHIFVSGRNLGPAHFEFFQWFMYPCYRALAGCPGVHFLTNSEAGRLDYARWLRLDLDDVRVLRNGLQGSDFAVVSKPVRKAAREELGLPAAAPVVTGAFRLSGEKRPLLWIDAAAQIKELMPDCHFLLCGVGPMQRKVEARAARHDLTSHLTLLGTRSDIATIFSASDLVMQSSLQEGTPNVLLEAQAMGVPVVTLPAFGAAEAVENGVTGLVVHDETASGLAQAAVSILRDAGFPARVRKEGPRFVEERFGFERMIDDTLVAYADAGVKWAADFLPEERKYRFAIPLADAVHESDRCWTFHLPQLMGLSDSAENPRRSPLVVLEDGVPVGPPHSMHEAIRSTGGGAFSHWGDGLYFSSRDGTSPAANGRRYLAVVPRGCDS